MLITYYHNVVTDELDEFDRRTPRMLVRAFEKQMEYLARFFRPVGLPEMLAMMDAGEDDPKAVAVTFDDACYGVYAHARGILEGLGIPATVYVVTGHAGERKLFSFDRVEIAFRVTPQLSLNADFLGLPEQPLDGVRARVDAMRAVKKQLKLTPFARLAACHETLLERLGVSVEECEAYAVGFEKFRQMNWGDLRELGGKYWTIGSHTRTHQAVAQLGDAERLCELAGSAEDLRTHLGLREMPFAFPYGEMSHVGETGADGVRAAGYTCAVTTVPGYVRGNTDRFLLNRVAFERLVIMSAA